MPGGMHGPNGHALLLPLYDKMAQSTVHSIQTGRDKLSDSGKKKNTKTGRSHNVGKKGPEPDEADVKAQLERTVRERTEELKAMNDEIQQEVINRRLAEERIIHMNNVLRAIRDVNQLITREKDRKKLIKNACRTMVKNRSYKGAWIALLDRSGKFASFAHSGIGKEHKALERKILGKGEINCIKWAMSQEDMVVVSDPASMCKGCPISKTYGGFGALCVRLKDCSMTYGIMSISLPISALNDQEEKDLFRELAGDIGYALSNIEIEERRHKAERELSESENLYRTLVENIPQKIFMKDTKFRWLKINKNMARDLGIEPDEAYGKVDRDFFPKELADKYRSDDKRILKTRNTETLEERYLQDDEYRWVHTVKTPVINDKGAVEGILGVFWDITERKRAEEELLLKNIVFDSSISANSIADTEGNLTHVNESFLKLWGYGKKEEVLGKSIADFFANQEDTGPVLTALGERGQWAGEFLAKRKDGSTFISRGLSTSIKDENGELVGYQSANMDITDERVMEEKLVNSLQNLERSNKELEQFAYVASHDLQEPLRMISSYVQLLERRYKDKLDQDANDFINYAVDGANRMQNLINDLLQFSRVMTRGKPPKQVDVASVVDRSCTYLQNQIDNSGAKIATKNLPKIMADENQMIQIFQNLIGNAIKFSGKAKPEIDISARDQGDVWEFSVRDNGIGIAPEYHDRIFVIFQCLHEKKKYPGTGIGLAVCKRIVERHGGKLWIESEPKKGSTFHFTLPKDPKRMWKNEQ